MRAVMLTAALAATTVLAAGCGGAQPTGHGHGGHAGHDMAGMSAQQMADMDMGAASRPSDAATMVCGQEIRGAVRRTLHLRELPAAPTSTWRRTARSYTCRYRLADGALEMSVQDAVEPAAGRAYFRHLRASTPGAMRLHGLESLGLPGFETSDSVAFLKDGKTLQVRTGDLAGSALPRGFDRQEVAYSLASAVVACWAE